jgi:hypothetical protein
MDKDPVDGLLTSGREDGHRLEIWVEGAESRTSTLEDTESRLEIYSQQLILI